MNEMKNWIVERLHRYGTIDPMLLSLCHPNSDCKTVMDAIRSLVELKMVRYNGNKVELVENSKVDNKKLYLVVVGRYFDEPQVFMVRASVEPTLTSVIKAFDIDVKKADKVYVIPANPKPPVEFP